VDWHDTYGSGKLNLRKVPGMKGQFVFPRSTFWVHPVCYAWSMAGRLGLRNALFNWRSDSDQYRNPRKQLKLGDDISSYTEPPLWNMITSQPRPDTLVDFPRNKFLISVFKAKAGTALGGSCLRPLAWWWVASNFCGDWLLNYAQLFGIPFRKATYKPGTSVDQQAEIRQMLQSCGSAGYILLPDTAELEFMDGGKGGAQSPQAFLFHFADSQKRKVILHQTMTGGQHDSMGKGGGKAFGDVENETKEQCIGAGARFASAQINLQLVPMILDLNYDTDADLEAPQVKLVDNEVGGLPDAQRDQVLAQIMPLPVSWLRSKYGVPKPGPDDEVAGIDAGIQGANAQQQQDNIDADRKQADVHAKMQVKQQADAAKAHADAVAKQPKAVPGQAVAPAPGQTPKQPGQQEKQPGADDNAEMDARNAELEAKDAASGGKGCLMAPLPADEIERFVSWAKDNVPEDAVTGDGIETEPHVTVFYGFNLGFDTDKLAELLKRRKPVTFTVGKLSRFKCPDYDVLKFDIESPDLENLHKLIAGKFKDDVTPSEHAYHPHLTASYIKKGSLTELDGEDPFEGEQFTVSSLLFSEPEHTNRRTVELKAIAMSIHPDDREVAATALHESVEPILDRIAAIEKIGHKATRVKMMRKLLKDVPHLAAAMMHDDSLAKAVAPAFVRKFAEGLAKGKKPK
jgi:2'-5' RNA ligase